MFPDDLAQNGLELVIHELLQDYLYVIVLFVLIVFWVIRNFVWQPFDFWRKERYEAIPEVVSLSPGKGDAPVQTIESHEKMKEQMEACGFEHVTTVMYQFVDSELRIFIGLHVQPAAQVAGLTVQYFEGWGQTALTHEFHYVQFISEYQHGPWLHVETTNIALANLFPIPPRYFVSRLPHLTDMNTLLQNHEGIVRAVNPEQRSVLSLQGRDFDQAVSYILAKTGVEDYEHAVEKGYLKKSRDGLTYRPTLPGAFMLQWKLTFPVRQIREALMRRRAMKIEENLKAGSSGLFA